MKNSENTIIYIKMKGEDGLLYESVGVLMEEADDHVRIAFNANNDVVKDDLIVKKTEIVEYKII